MNLLQTLGNKTTLADLFKGMGEKISKSINVAYLCKIVNITAAFSDDQNIPFGIAEIDLIPSAIHSALFPLGV